MQASSFVHVHQDQPVLTAGAPLGAAQMAVVLLHGRGGSAQDMLGLAAALPQTQIAYLMPQAANRTWYPRSGFIPMAENEPYVSSAFRRLSEVLAQIASAGIPVERIVLGGFSQGACLAAEYVVQHAQRYGGLIVLSGALMGPPDTPRQYTGSLAGTPVYVGGSDRDSWVTEAQLRLTAQVLRDLGGAVKLAIQPGAVHTIWPEDVEAASALIAQAASAAAGR